MPPLLPRTLFDACPVQTLRVGDVAVQLSAAPDIDALLDFYASTQPSNDHAIPYYAVLWDSAKALASHLAARHGTLAGRSVVELGCGLGLPSIVAAMRGARVTATDFHPDCEAFLRRNAEQNGVTLEFAALDWSAVPSDWPTFDFVLASDVIYHAASLPHLVAAASRLCHAGGLILFADPGRDRLQAAVDAFAAHGFHAELHAVGEVFVFELRRAVRLNGFVRGA
jgi:predicted nicotinamide N-methyase